VPSTLDSSLVDTLVPVVDSLRAALYPLMGTGAYQVHLVRRRWSGARRSQGTPSIVSDTVLSPQPRVKFPDNEQALGFEAEATGRQEEGNVDLTEVSLQYTEAELTGEPISLTDEFYYKLVDAHGQQIKARYYVPRKPPIADREKNIGWTIYLKRVEIEE